MAAQASDVKVGLEAIARAITVQREVLKKAIQNSSVASAALAALAVDYGTVVTAVNAYGTVDAFEANAKATLAKLVSEYQALKAIADAIAATVV